MITHKITKILIFIIFLLYPFNIYSASIEEIEKNGSLDGVISEKIILDTKYLQIDIIAKSNSDLNFNTIDLNLQFDNTELKLITTENEKSFCDIVLNNKINNEKGKFLMQCGAFGYNSSNDAKIITLLFQKLTHDYTTDISFNNSRLLANDGHGTDILSNYLLPLVMPVNVR